MPFFVLYSDGKWYSCGVWLGCILHAVQDFGAHYYNDEDKLSKTNTCVDAQNKVVLPSGQSSMKYFGVRATVEYTNKKKTKFKIVLNPGKKWHGLLADNPYAHYLNGKWVIKNSKYDNVRYTRAISRSVSVISSFVSSAK